MTAGLFCAWGALYLLTVGLGFLTGVTGLLKGALAAIALVFFVPGALLLWKGYEENNRRLIVSIRWICAMVLALTTCFLLAFFLCAAFASEAVVNVVFVLLSLVSAPMLCGQYWFLGLFGWACLLFAAFLKK